MESGGEKEIKGYESKFIVQFESNTPAIDYNQWLKFKG